MNSSAASPTSPPAALRRLSLVIQQIGHVPAFKNKKRAIQDKRTGKLRTLTEPKAAKWMQAAIHSFESQLRSYLAIIGTATSTGHFPPSLTASVAPLDDSREWIKAETIEWKQVPKGEEGALVSIEIYQAGDPK